MIQTGTILLSMSWIDLKSPRLKERYELFLMSGPFRIPLGLDFFWGGGVRSFVSCMVETLLFMRTVPFRCMIGPEERV